MNIVDVLADNPVSIYFMTGKNLYFEKKEIIFDNFEVKNLASRNLVSLLAKTINDNVTGRPEVHPLAV